MEPDQINENVAWYAPNLVSTVIDDYGSLPIITTFSINLSTQPIPLSDSANQLIRFSQSIILKLDQWLKLKSIFIDQNYVVV